MPKVKSFDALSALKKSAQLQEGMDIIPDDMQNTVVPVIDITPRNHRVCNISRFASTITNTNVTLYTTPSDQDFFLIGIALSAIKDATCDMATGSCAQVSAVIDGTTQNMCAVAGITLTAQNSTMSIVFPFPIKIDRGTAITSARGATYSVGLLSRAVHIVGYTVVNPQGN